MNNVERMICIEKKSLSNRHYPSCSTISHMIRKKKTVHVRIYVIKNRWKTKNWLNKRALCRWRTMTVCSGWVYRHTYMYTYIYIYTYICLWKNRQFLFLENRCQNSWLQRQRVREFHRSHTDWMLLMYLF